MNIEIERELLRKLALLAKDRGQSIEECANALLTEALDPLHETLDALQKKAEQDEANLSKTAA